MICVFSNLTETELANAPQVVREYFAELPVQYTERVLITDEILALAQQYVAEKVVGKTSFDDCIHIAAVTVTGKEKFQDFLVKNNVFTNI